jgi:hypothetical protein
VFAGGVHAAVAVIAPPATPAVAVPITGAPGATARVVKVHDVVASGTLPVADRIAVVPPVSVARYVVPATGLAFGFNVALLVTVVPAAGVTAAPTKAPTGLPAASSRWRRNVVPLTPRTGALNAAVMFAPTATPVALIAGARVVTVGAAAPAGVTAFDDAEATLEPNWFTAITLKVYVVPLVSPVTTRDVAVAAMPVMFATCVVPLNACTVKLVTPSGLPAGSAAQLTVAWALPATADTPVGADGADTVIVVSVNRSRSIPVRVSVPSVPVLSVTVVFPPTVVTA